MQKEIAQAANEFYTAAENFRTACENIEQATTPRGREILPLRTAQDMRNILFSLESNLEFLFDTNNDYYVGNKATQAKNAARVFRTLPAPVKKDIISVFTDFQNGFISFSHFQIELFFILAENEKQGAALCTMRAVYYHLFNNIK